MLFSTVFILLPLFTASWAAIVVPISGVSKSSAPSKRYVESTTSDNNNRYFISGGLGTPEQTGISWIVDTGSPDLWTPGYNSSVCLAGGCPYGSYNPSASSTHVLTEVGGLSISYDVGEIYAEGDLFTDTLDFAGISLKDVSQGVAYNYSASFTSGIMGLSFATTADTYPSVLGQLLAQGFIDRAAFTVWENAPPPTLGELVFGGVDSAKYSGDLIALNMQPDFVYLAVAMTGFSLVDAQGVSHSLQPAGDVGNVMFIDTGNPSVFSLPPALYGLFVEAIGAVTEGGTVAVPCDLSSSTATLDFTFGGAGGPTIVMPISALVSGETALATPFYAPDGTIIPACAIAVSPSTTANGGVFGIVWQRYAYMLFDLENKVIALAQAITGTDASNIVDIPSGTGYPGVSSTVLTTLAGTGSATTYTPASATSSVSGTVTEYACVTPEYNLGVPACTTTSSSTTSSSTSSTTTSTSSSTTSTTTTTTSTTSTSTTSTPSSSSSSTSSSSSSSLSSTVSSSTWSTSTYSTLSSSSTSPTSSKTSSSSQSSSTASSTTWSNTGSSSSSTQSSSTWNGPTSSGQPKSPNSTSKGAGSGGSPTDPASSTWSTLTTSASFSVGGWGSASGSGSPTASSVSPESTGSNNGGWGSDGSSSGSSVAPHSTGSDDGGWGSSGSGSGSFTVSSFSAQSTDPSTTWGSWSADPTSSTAAGGWGSTVSTSTASTKATSFSPQSTGASSAWGSWSADPKSSTAAGGWGSASTLTVSTKTSSYIASPATSTSSSATGGWSQPPATATYASGPGGSVPSYGSTGSASSALVVSATGVQAVSASTSASAWASPSGVQPFTGAAGSHTPVVALLLGGVMAVMAFLL